MACTSSSLSIYGPTCELESSSRKLCKETCRHLRTFAFSLSVCRIFFISLMFVVNAAIFLRKSRQFRRFWDATNDTPYQEMLNKEKQDAEERDCTDQVTHTACQSLFERMSLESLSYSHVVVILTDS